MYVYVCGDVHVCVCSCLHVYPFIQVKAINIVAIILQQGKGLMKYIQNVCLLRWSLV